MNCTCKDWKLNIDKINAPITLLTLRFGGQYQFDGVPFHYCPWCGKELQDERESEKQNPTGQPPPRLGGGCEGEES